jgi:transcriptional regulator with PAS, ATPase and Fis domain
VSGLYQNGERQAYLWMAREYFAEEEVTPYLEKVDAALTVGAPTRLALKDNAPAIIAESKAIKDLVRRADNIAAADMSVLLTGETGTGKDLFARYIHEVSGREGQFVPVNAAAIPNDLVEAELFGHCQGAFTNAVGDRTGLIEQADHGTFYLNEIADATPELQAKLL